MAERNQGDQPKVPPTLKNPDDDKDQDKAAEPEPIKSMIGAIVLTKNPNGQYNPAIVIEDHGGNFKMVAFWDSGQRMGQAETIVIQDCQPEPKDADEAELNRAWAYWRAI